MKETTVHSLTRNDHDSEERNETKVHNDQKSHFAEQMKSPLPNLLGGDITLQGYFKWLQTSDAVATSRQIFEAWSAEVSNFGSIRRYRKVVILPILMPRI